MVETQISVSVFVSVSATDQSETQIDSLSCSVVSRAVTPRPSSQPVAWSCWRNLQSSWSESVDLFSITAAGMVAPTACFVFVFY